MPWKSQPQPLDQNDNTNYKKMEHFLLSWSWSRCFWGVLCKTFHLLRYISAWKLHFLVKSSSGIWTFLSWTECICNARVGVKSIAKTSKVVCKSRCVFQISNRLHWHEIHEFKMNIQSMFLDVVCSYKEVQINGIVIRVERIRLGVKKSCV